jgi:tryptophan halogenase
MMNVVVIGGGTAGWLSALFLKRRMDDIGVTLIESKSIGVIGVGEGTTPNIVPFLKKLGIDETDFITKTKATKKIGISFEGWQGNDSSFNHDFHQKSNSSYAYHFDNNKIGNYFKKLGISRNINHIEGDVIGFDKTGDDINTIHLKDGTSIQTDFIIDCSGFKRLVIGRELLGEWISHKDQLTLNSAIPFRIPLIDSEEYAIDSKTRTRAISMKNGWMWMVPLQDRWGCGYVFDDRYINQEGAKHEVEEYLKTKIEVNRKIQFESGYFKDVWIGNSVAIGLSGGFFEPLEATSIMTVITQLNNLRKTKLNKELQDWYNASIQNFNNQVYNFIKYHYLCERDDTDFWKDYKSHKLPETLSKLLTNEFNLKYFDNSKIAKIFDVDDTELIFDSYNYSTVGLGNFKKSKKELF